MKYVDEFRDPQCAAALLAAIRSLATRRWTIMEVCGGQTHALLRYGIEDELLDTVELLHGPGCPVCVTSVEAIENALALALRPGFVLASFGDMLRVPGSRRSLLQARSAGGDVRIVYSPIDAVALAQREPQLEVVFFAVGFETTTPATALAVLQADRLGLANFSLLCSHVCVQPAMEMIASSVDCGVNGFLAAGHVCAVTGYQSYHDFAERFHLPVVVTGFEPIDLLAGIHECIRQLESGEAHVANPYERSVRADGNSEARRIVDEVFEVCDRPWRGLGIVPGGGLQLRSRWSHFDAERRHGSVPFASLDSTQCPSGEVLAGRLRPPDCPHFGRTCHPDNPLGAPMVSAEGACSAYFRYRSSKPSVVEAERG